MQHTFLCSLVVVYWTRFTVGDFAPRNPQDYPCFQWNHTICFNSLLIWVVTAGAFSDVAAHPLPNCIPDNKSTIWLTMRTSLTKKNPQNNKNGIEHHFLSEVMWPHHFLLPTTWCRWMFSAPPSHLSAEDGSVETATSNVETWVQITGLQIHVTQPVSVCVCPTTQKNKQIKSNQKATNQNL